MVAELHRTPFASSMSAVMVASRGVLCANSSVRALGGAAAIADACQDLLQRRHKRTLTEHNGAKKGNTQKGACGCSLYATAKVDALRDAALATPMDVEDLGTLGRRMGACPYFAARSAVAEADVVLLPYSALLVKVVLMLLCGKEGCTCVAWSILFAWMMMLCVEGRLSRRRIKGVQLCRVWPTSRRPHDTGQPVKGLHCLPTTPVQSVQKHTNPSQAHINYAGDARGAGRALGQQRCDIRRGTQRGQRRDQQPCGGADEG